MDMVDNIQQLEKYAEENNIPIMQKDGIEFLLKFIKDRNIENILEIGTAIGYSAIRMCEVNDKIKVTTIERDNERYMEALKNIKNFGLEDRITIIFKDASEVVTNEKYDLIFIDAAKAQNENFFLRFQDNLNDNGYIVTDNLSFHGFVEKDIEEIESKNVRGIVRKIKSYIEFLKNNKNFVTKFYELGDRISISKRV